MGEVGDHGMRAVSKRPKIYMSVLLIIIFAEALGLYGLIISLIVLTNGNGSKCDSSVLH
jgi:V-type H+-transporting ATPase proteolipid subunit